MPFVRMMRMLSAMESGQLSGAALEALLQEPGRLGELQVLILDRALRKRMYASVATLQALLNSTSATGALLDLMAADALATVPAALMASPLAVSKLLASSSKKMAVFNSGVALEALAANPTALAAFRAAPSAAVFTTNLINGAAVAITGIVGTGSYICLGASTDAASNPTVTIATRKQGTPATFVVQKSTGADGTSGGGAMAVAIAQPLTVNHTISGWVNISLRLLRCDI